MEKVDILIVTGSDNANGNFLEMFIPQVFASQMLENEEEMIEFESDFGENIITAIFTDVPKDFYTFLYNKVIVDKDRTGIYILESK